MKNQCLVNSGLNTTLTIASPKQASLLAMTMIVGLLTHSPVALAQGSTKANVQLEQIRWKSEDQVRSLLGDPKSIRGPIGTHASYQLWNYEGYSVAFANNRAFHLFDENSLKKLQLEEQR